MLTKRYISFPSQTHTSSYFMGEGFQCSWKGWVRRELSWFFEKLKLHLSYEMVWCAMTTAVFWCDTCKLIVDNVRQCFSAAKIPSIDMDKWNLMFAPWTWNVEHYNNIDKRDFFYDAHPYQQKNVYIKFNGATSLIHRLIIFRWNGALFDVFKHVRMMMFPSNIRSFDSTRWKEWDWKRAIPAIWLIGVGLGQCLCNTQC